MSKTGAMERRCCGCVPSNWCQEDVNASCLDAVRDWPSISGVTWNSQRFV